MFKACALLGPRPKVSVRAALPYFCTLINQNQQS